MALLFDILHFFAAALLAVIGFEYEREEDCDPVHYQPAAYVTAGDASTQTLWVNDPTVTAQPASDCDSSTQSVTYPVL